MTDKAIERKFADDEAAINCFRWKITRKNDDAECDGEIVGGAFFADDLLSRVSDLRFERDALVAWLREQKYDVAESDANFVLFRLFEDRHAIWQGLLDHGVLIRETGPDGWLRVSVGTPEEMAAFRSALLEVDR